MTEKPITAPAAIAFDRTTLRLTIRAGDQACVVTLTPEIALHLARDLLDGGLDALDARTQSAVEPSPVEPVTH